MGLQVCKQLCAETGSAAGGLFKQALLWRVVQGTSRSRSWTPSKTATSTLLTTLSLTSLYR